jgi:hypothetical protein
VSDEKLSGAEFKLQFSPNDRDAAWEFMTECGRLMQINTSLTLLQADKLASALEALSWWLAGIAVLCDWIG